MRSNAHRRPTYCPEMCFHCLRCQAALEAAEAEASRAVLRCDHCGDEMPAGDACRRLRDEGARGREASDHVFCPSCAAEYDEEIGPSRADEDDATHEDHYRPLRGQPPLEDH